MKKAVIFGASAGGRNVYKHLAKNHPGQYQVIAFVDNDQSKHGTSIFGLPVKSPAEINELHPETIFIGSCYVDEIGKQLTGDLGIPATKIEILDQYILNGATTSSSTPVIIIGALLVVGLATAAYFIF